MRQTNTYQIYVLTEQTKTAPSNRFLGGLLCSLGVFLISILITSCDSLPPKYEVYPTLSIEKQRKYPLMDSNDPYYRWRTRFETEMNMMVQHEWIPTIDLLQKTFEEVSKEYRFESNSPDFNSVRKAFSEKFQLEANLPNRNCLKYDPNKNCDVYSPNTNCLTCGIHRMLKLIDLEHPNLLVDTSRLKLPPAAYQYSLPSLVSGYYPVDVATTEWTSPNPAKSDVNNTTIIVGGTVITSSKPPLIVAPDYKSLASQQNVAKDDMKSKNKKALAESKKVNTGAVDDFNSEQHVTLNLSTALNSPSTFDRIEYVSTYLYLQPFPFPPNCDVVLEREFWRRFASLNGDRDPLDKNDAALNDMMRAIEEMRARITNIETTVKLRDVDLGSLTRKTSDKFNVGLSATATVPPVWTSIGPNLGYSSEVSTEAFTKLKQELDQRSTYIDPDGKFLRITQRGMLSVNLAGNFVEDITLSVPPAEDQILVLMPVKSSKVKAAEYQVTWLLQPLYSRVDAFTLSVVVARQATSLAKSTKDSFRLDDPKDAAFIVGVTRPYRITLWQNKRVIDVVTTGDIFGNDAKVPKNRDVYFTTFDNERPHPLLLYNFAPEQMFELCRKIQNSAKPDYKLVHLRICDACKPNSITIGLPNDPNNPTNLVNFKR
jgi:hypothetical protein